MAFCTQDPFTTTFNKNKPTDEVLAMIKSIYHSLSSHLFAELVESVQSLRQYLHQSLHQYLKNNNAKKSMELLKDGSKLTSMFLEIDNGDFTNYVVFYTEVNAFILNANNICSTN